MTGFGPVAVRQPRVRDREADAGDPERIRFTPAILPPYALRSKSLEMLIPILYLKGVSTGDFEEALATLLGKDAPWLVGLDDRAAEGGLDRRAQALERARPFHQALRLRLGQRHSSAGAFGGQCAMHPLIIGATPEGGKELVGFTDARVRVPMTGAPCCSI